MKTLVFQLEVKEEKNKLKALPQRSLLPGRALSLLSAIYQVNWAKVGTRNAPELFVMHPLHLFAD